MSTNKTIIEENWKIYFLRSELYGGKFVDENVRENYRVFLHSKVMQKRSKIGKENTVSVDGIKYVELESVLNTLAVKAFEGIE